MPPHFGVTSIIIMVHNPQLNLQIGVSQELLDLKQRAKKLSEDLKNLSTAAEDLRSSGYYILFPIRFTNTLKSIRLLGKGINNFLYLSIWVESVVNPDWIYSNIHKASGAL